ncbi:MAG: hypothetical protein EAX96_11680 [Candidatus Lokiarchaeota archaeon]|nr:hypothetical protein [Candidatus Lokiarchaeota archaeon]
MEEIIYKEAEFLYKRFPFLKPIEGNLRNWRGQVTLKNKEKINILIKIPENFPKSKPKIMTEEEFDHKFIKNKKIMIPLLANWNENLHIYQIINSVLVHFNKNFPKFKKGKNNKSKQERSQNEVIESYEPPVFFNTELEKKALNELIETLKIYKKQKKITQKSYKTLFSRYLTEIKKIEEIKKLVV